MATPSGVVRCKRGTTMMYWNGDGGWPDNGAGYVLMVLGMVVFWGMIIAAIALVLRRSAPTADGVGEPAPALRTPEQVLATRFASGEVDESEFASRLATLRRHRVS
jgi:putative membrane protein